MKKILVLSVILLANIAIMVAAGCNESSNCIGGEWNITKCNGKAIMTDSDNVPFILFNLSDGRIYGNNSCNVINGSFTAYELGQIKIDNLISTMMACRNSSQEYEIMKSLNQTTKYAITMVEGREYLNLLNEKADTLLQLKRNDLTFLNGTWRVFAFNDSLVGENDAKLVIDINEKTLHGNSGCNIVNGVVVLDRSKDDAIEFANLISTRMLCPNIQFETELLLALENAETVKAGETDEFVVFYDANNQAILTLKREMVCTTVE